MTVPLQALGTMDTVLAIVIVLKMKEIVIPIMSVKMANYVEQTIVQYHLDFTLKSIAVILQHLVMKFFVHLIILVMKMKEIVIL